MNDQEGIELKSLISELEAENKRLKEEMVAIRDRLRDTCLDISAILNNPPKAANPPSVMAVHIPT